MVASINSALGCDKPSGIILDLEKNSCIEYDPFFLKNVAYMAADVIWLLTLAVQIVRILRLTASAGIITL